MSTENKNTPAVQKASPSQRFSDAIFREVTTTTGTTTISEYQKRLSKNYFIYLDGVLKKAEAKRLAKDEKYREPLAYTWENINMSALAVDVVAYSSIGLDPTQKNHLSLIPYKDNTLGNYKIEFREEYRGLELKAKKYGYDVPDEIIIEVVYETDHFKSLKKSLERPVEAYEFEITDDFNRGEIKGGFYYYNFKNNPEKNRLRVFNMKDIEKRIPKNAATEFWGGEKDVWKDGKKVGKETVEGWRDEMVYKTIARAAYNNITIDAAKIDDHVLRMIENDQNTYYLDDAQIDQQPQKKQGNLTELNIEDAQEVEVVKEEPKSIAAKSEQETAQVPAKDKAEPVKKADPEAKVDKDGIPQLNFGS